MSTCPFHPCNTPINAWPCSLACTMNEGIPIPHQTTPTYPSARKPSSNTTQYPHLVCLLSLPTEGWIPFLLSSHLSFLFSLSATSPIPPRKRSINSIIPLKVIRISIPRTRVMPILLNNPAIMMSGSRQVPLAIRSRRPSVI